MVPKTVTLLLVQAVQADMDGNMKNLFIILGIILLVNPVLAGGVGYINYEKVVDNYQFAKNSLREIETKNREIEQYLQAKEQEFAKIDSAVQKKKFEETVRTELQARERAFNDFRNKREEEVYTRIHAVTEKIRLEKGLDAIIDARSVFSGGVDITDTLIQKLNHQ